MLAVYTSQYFFLKKNYLLKPNQIHTAIWHILKLLKYNLSNEIEIENDYKIELRLRVDIKINLN